MNASDCHRTVLDPNTVSEFVGTTVMVIGRPGSGKSTVAREIASQMESRGSPTALLCADVGQPVVGVPTCLALSVSPPWNQAVRLWFIGETTPVGNLVPVLAGVAQLVRDAQKRDRRSIVLDTTGLVDGAVGRLLKYHKALVADVEQVVVLERESELERLVPLLSTGKRRMHRLRPVEAARDRSANERRVYRERLLAECFAKARLVEFPGECVLHSDWTVGPARETSAAVKGTLVGLLDDEGYCRGLGLVERAAAKRWTIATAYEHPEAVDRIQVGRIVLDRNGRQWN